ncbi:unnamed protein product, partial [Discosporangium mesarthrocarpum]
QARELSLFFPLKLKGGCFREDIVVHLFSRITDLDNFYLVLDTLGQEGALSVANRLGWLNIFNPHFADRRYELDLRQNDHRRTCIVLADMAVNEPGPNLQNTTFSRHSDPARFALIPGWEVPSSWHALTSSEYATNVGVPDDGYLCLEYCS